MLIKPFRNYVVHCRDVNHIEYRWHLNVKPGSNAWKIVNQKIEIGDVFKGYFILSIDEVFRNQSFALIQGETSTIEKCISKNEFEFAVDTFDFGFAVSSSYSQVYKCQLCDAIVVNNRCTNCMFDWDG